MGYNQHAKSNGIKYETYGCPFVTPGAAGATFRLYDMKIVGTLSAVTKKTNYIQLFQTDTLKLDDVNAFFWDYSKVSAVTGETGCWCYKNSDTGTGQVANEEVPHDVTFPAGAAFLFNCPTDNKSVGLQFAGQVIKPVPDEDGYISISKTIGLTEVKYMFFANPFPVPITLADMKVGGTLTAVTKKTNFIQRFQTTSLKLDDVKSYFWDYAKVSAVSGATGCWCYKTSDTTTGQAANSEVLDAGEIVVDAGEGFLFTTPTAGKGVCIKIKVPASILGM